MCLNEEKIILNMDIMKKIANHLEVRGFDRCMRILEWTKFYYLNIPKVKFLAFVIDHKYGFWRIDLQHATTVQWSVKNRNDFE